jgi:hypothetical protein
LNSRRRLAFLAFVVAGACALGIVVNAGANHSQTDLLSIGPTGGNGAFDSYYGQNSADGSRLYFTTAERLVSTDTDSSTDVYERVGSTTNLISTGSINGNGAHEAHFAGISADGAHVFFDTSEQLASTDTDTARDVYERFGGSTTEVSIGPAGGNSSIDSFYTGTSTDGTKVFFTSYDKLTSDDTDTGRKDVYERSGGTVTLVSTGANGAYGAEFDGATPDGTHVFFHTDESMVGGDTDSVSDVYERSGGTTTRVTIGSINGNGAFVPLYKGVSQDGSRVFFVTNEQLTTSDTDSFGDVYQRSGGVTTELSVGPNGGNAPYDSNFGGASADGSKVWIQTRDALLSSDTDGLCEDEFEQFIIPCRDIYERSGATTTLISAGGSGSFDASFAAGTADGSHVFFHTNEPLSVSDTDPNTLDVYDRSGGNTILVSAGGNGSALYAGASKDGARVFFQTYEQLVSEDTDNWIDVYERYSGATTLISTGPTSTSGANFPFYYGNSEDGTKVFFDTDEKLTSGDTDNQVDIYSASQVLAGFPRPKGATPTRLSLVPAYGECTSPNRIHGPPDYPFNGPNPDGSCNPPAADSGVLTVGSPDANNKTANSTSSVKFRVLAAPGNVEIVLAMNDVWCRVANAACPGGAISEYTGKVLLSARIRLTDKSNGSPLVESATVQDFDLQVPVQCVATATADGGNCAVTTTVNSLLPGSILDGKRSIWSLESVKVLDPGPNGTGFGSGCPTTCGDGDETVFMRPGVFVP